MASTPAWRDALYARLAQDSVRVPRAQFDAMSALVDRWIGGQVARVAFGDSAAFRRSAPQDAQLQRALDLLAKARTQDQLFTLATSATLPR